MIDHYLTVGQLKDLLAGLPDDTKVYYERIEDIYFTEHGWKADKLIQSDMTEPEDNIKDEYVRAFCAFAYNGDLYITAHY